MLSAASSFTPDGQSAATVYPDPLSLIISSYPGCYADPAVRALDEDCGNFAYVPELLPAAGHAPEPLKQWYEGSDGSEGCEMGLEGNEENEGNERNDKLVTLSHVSPHFSPKFSPEFLRTFSPPFSGQFPPNFSQSSPPQQSRRSSPLFSAEQSEWERESAEAVAADLSRVRQALVLGKDPTNAHFFEGVRVPPRYAYDNSAKLLRHPHSGIQHICSYPGVSWNTRMRSWLVYYEDVRGRKSKTFNPKRYESGPDGQTPLEVSMHRACAFAASARYKAMLLKISGLRVGRAGRAARLRTRCQQPMPLEPFSLSSASSLAENGDHGDDEAAAATFAFSSSSPFSPSSASPPPISLSCHDNNNNNNNNDNLLHHLHQLAGDQELLLRRLHPEPSPAHHSTLCFP